MGRRESGHRDHAEDDRSSRCTLFYSWLIVHREWTEISIQQMIRRRKHLLHACFESSLSVVIASQVLVFLLFLLLNCSGLEFLWVCHAINSGLFFLCPLVPSFLFLSLRPHFLLFVRGAFLPTERKNGLLVLGFLCSSSHALHRLLLSSSFVSGSREKRSLAKSFNASLVSLLPTWSSISFFFLFVIMFSRLDSSHILHHH